jgi:hypothetical protein
MITTTNLDLKKIIIIIIIIIIIKANEGITMSFEVIESRIDQEWASEWNS